MVRFNKYLMRFGMQILFITVLWMNCHNGLAQELEPRSLTNIPVGTNFAMAGYAFAMGDIMMDPAIPIEGLNARLHTFVAAYVRSVNLFGSSGKIDVIVPYGFGDWGGQVAGTDSSTSRTGFGDVRVRLSVNMLGAPALNGSQFSEYNQRTIAGFNIQVIMPVGQYNPEKLINLGSNRFTFRPQVGISHKTGLWILETYCSVWIFLDNDDFYGGNHLSQDALITFKVHAIRSLPKGMWIAGGLGYGIGGKNKLNGEYRDTRISSMRLGLTFALPIKERHAIKFNLASGIRFERGPDFDAFGIAYQFRWGGSSTI